MGLGLRPGSITLCDAKVTALHGMILYLVHVSVERHCMASVFSIYLSGEVIASTVCM